jgi:CBS domain-containing membrane protein
MPLCGAVTRQSVRITDTGSAHSVTLKPTADRRIDDRMSEGEKPDAMEPVTSEPAAAEPVETEAAAAAPAPAEPEPAGGLAAVPETAATEATPEGKADAAPIEPPPSEDPDRETMEVEAVVVDQAKSGAPHAAHHHPPPPPSIRVKGATGSRARLEVTGNPKLAQDLMTRKLFTIGQDDIIAHMEEHMQAFRFRHLPVVDDRKLIGLISHTDLLRASASLFSAKAKAQDELIHQLPAKHIMQREVVTVRPTDTLEEVAVVMWEGKLGCVLVTEEDKTLVGIITEGDFIRLAHHFLVQGRASPA